MFWFPPKFKVCHFLGFTFAGIFDLAFNSFLSFALSKSKQDNNIKKQNQEKLVQFLCYHCYCHYILGLLSKFFVTESNVYRSMCLSKSKPKLELVS